MGGSLQGGLRIMAWVPNDQVTQLVQKCDWQINANHDFFACSW